MRHPAHRVSSFEHERTRIANSNLAVSVNISCYLKASRKLSPPNATAPAPEVGHEIKLINFSQQSSAGEDDQGDQGDGGAQALVLKIQGFARNTTGDQAFLDEAAASTVQPKSSSAPMDARTWWTMGRFATTEPILISSALITGLYFRSPAQA
jgi:hypothetical protein